MNNKEIFRAPTYYVTMYTTIEATFDVRQTLIYSCLSVKRVVLDKYDQMDFCVDIAWLCSQRSSNHILKSTASTKGKSGMFSWHQ
jgi:hypothetical protein